MDFVSYIRDQSEKLNSRTYVIHLWDELEENNNAETEISSNAVNDFHNHLPLLLEQFWEIALEKLNESSDIDEIDEDLKVYLLVLIYQCTTQSNDVISTKCIINASDLYIHLLTTPQGDDFYKSKLYTSVLTTLKTFIETGVADEDLIVVLMKKLCIFLSKSKLNTSDLEITLATLINIILIKSVEIFHHFDVSLETKSLSHQALLCLKVLLDIESVSSRKCLIITYLFNGLRNQNSLHILPQHFNIIQTNFRNLCKDLHYKFKEDNYRTFLNAFIHIWGHPEFSFYGEAVLIMNNLKEKYYRSLIEILIKMIMSRNIHRNLFKLSLAIICYPPRYAVVEKVKITNEILLRNILINCLSSKSETSNCAIESLAEILMSPDIEKDYIKDPVKKIFNSGDENVMNIPTVLQGLESLINKKWTNHTRTKNKNLFVIIISIILFCDNVYVEVYREILELLTDEASPFDLKPFLPLLSETYLKLIEKNHKYGALQILKIIFRMALHPMASSTEFVKYLYMAMVYPSVCKGVTIKSQLFIDPIISQDFNFTEFFQKCQNLGLIKNEHLNKLMNLHSINESNMKLISALVSVTDYKELSVIAEYINDNFMTICNSPYINYLLYIYNKIFKNCTAHQSHQNLRSNEIVICFIKHHLLRQNFRSNCVANAFALLKTLEEFTNLNEDFNKLKEEYDRRLGQVLRSNGSFLPSFYYSQLVIFGKVIPSEENLTAVENLLQVYSNEIHRRSPEFSPKLWIGCLFLYTNICIIKTSLIESGLNYVQNGLNCSLTVVKLASLNMTFDMCNMVTHNFEDLIKYMFKELVYGDSVFKKTCLLKIDRLIRDEYLKLELEQFLIFIPILGDRDLNLSDYFKQLLSESFFISNISMIAKYFVPLVVHINGYKKHPVYKLNNNQCHTMQLISKNILNRRKIYTLLFSNLTIKARFSIIYTLATNIFENMIKEIIKFDDGFWNMIKDSIFIFKLMTFGSNEDDFGENYYKKILGHITKYILQPTEYTEKSRQYQEFHREILQGTESLLKLLFFNDSNNIQKHIRISVFDALMHWTDFLLPDLIHIVHVDKYKKIQNEYLKVDQFFKKFKDTLKYTEESYQSASNANTTDLSTGIIFNATEDYVPSLDD